jgi:CDGSH-type Zn-finger protein
VNDATITPSDNGPYIIKGEVTLLDIEGNSYHVNGTVALCRCGHSYAKPFCDGSHEVTNFTAADRAGDSVSSDGFSNRHLHCLTGPPR